MAWHERPYYRDHGGSTGSPLMWLLTGSVPLFNVFRIYVRAHATLIIMLGIVLLFGLPGQQGTLLDRVQSMGILFMIVLLHEFGHCFTARWVGGEANEIVMHPLGGLALAQPPRRPLPTFLTIAGGPAVNVIICIACGVLLWMATGKIPSNPFRFEPFIWSVPWFNVYWYAWWVFQVSFMLLAFNLLPIYPLDGGQMLQSILWPWFGYYKATLFSCVTGMVGAVVGGLIALATGNLWLAILAVMGFLTCMNMRRQLIAIGPYEFEDETDYSAAYEPATPRRPRASRWAMRRARKRAMKENERARFEQERLDAILAKVSANGMHSLSWWERRVLRKATERRRQSEFFNTREP